MVLSEHLKTFVEVSPVFPFESLHPESQLRAKGHLLCVAGGFPRTPRESDNSMWPKSSHKQIKQPFSMTINKNLRFETFPWKSCYFFEGIFFLYNLIKQGVWFLQPTEGWSFSWSDFPTKSAAPKSWVFWSGFIFTGNHTLAPSQKHAFMFSKIPQFSSKNQTSVKKHHLVYIVEAISVATRFLYTFLLHDSPSISTFRHVLCWV